MQRMHPALAGHRPAGGDQRLRGDLTAEHPDRRDLRRDPAVQVVLEPLQVEQLDQAVDHGLTARNTVGVERRAVSSRRYRSGVDTEPRRQSA